MTLEWVAPPWRDAGRTEDPEWPEVGEQFLAAVPVIDNRISKTPYWEYWVLAWTESGLECDGEPWDAWDWADIEWIAKIDKPGDHK